MSLRKTRWSKVYESSEEELQLLLDNRKLDATTITIDAYEQAQHPCAEPIKIWCAEGSFTVATDEDQAYSMQPGDAIVITDSSQYAINGGITGATYYITSYTHKA